MSVELLLQFFVLGADGTWADTKTYVDAWTNSLSHLKIDIVRTPVYPLLLGFFGSVFGKGGMFYAIAIFQSLISVLCIPYLYKICLEIFKSRYASFLLTLFYALWPFLAMMWNHMILTESLATSFSILLIYNLLFVYKSGRLRYAVFSIILLFILIFLRPIFVYMLPVLFVSALLLWLSRNRRKLAFIIAIGTLVNSLLLVGYMHEFEKEYGFFAVSDVSVWNKDAIICYNGLLPKKHFATDYSKNNMAKINADINAFIENHKLQYISAIGKNFKRCCSESFFTDIYTSTAPFKVLIGQGWIVFDILLYLIFILLLTYRHRKLPWIEFVLLMLGASNLIIVVVGAQGDYSRLLLPSKFIYLIMAMEMLLAVFRKRNKLSKFLALT